MRDTANARNCSIWARIDPGRGSNNLSVFRGEL
jgi:hypothetical protein